MASLVERVTLRVADKSTATARPCKKALREAMPAGIMLPGAPCHHTGVTEAHGDGVNRTVDRARRDGAGAPPCSRIYANASMIRRGGRAEPEGPRLGCPKAAIKVPSAAARRADRDLQRGQPEEAAYAVVNSESR